MSKRKLLLADDSITIQKVVNLTFADEGIEVISVGDGDSAMRKFDEFMPDLVMADVNMPGLSGYDVCRIIKATEETQDIPVILLVGSFEPFDEAAAKEAGADDFLTKPFQSIRQLVNKVTDLLNRREKPAETPAGAEIAAPAVDSFAETLQFEKQESEPIFVERQEISSVAERQEYREAPAELETQPEEKSENAGRQEIASEFGDAGMDDEMIETSPANGYLAESRDEAETSIDYAKTQPLDSEDLKSFDIVAGVEDQPETPREFVDLEPLESAPSTERTAAAASEPPSFDEEARKLGFSRNYEESSEERPEISENEPEIDYYLPEEPEFDKELTDADTLEPEVSYEQESPRTPDFSQATDQDATLDESTVAENSSYEENIDYRETGAVREEAFESEPPSLAEETRLREVSEGADATPEAAIDLSGVGEPVEAREATPETEEPDDRADFSYQTAAQTETASEQQTEPENEPAAEPRAETGDAEEARTDDAPEAEPAFASSVETIDETPMAASMNAPDLDFDDGDLLELPPLVEETGIRPSAKAQPLVPEIVSEPLSAEPESKITVTKTVAESEIALSFPPELIEAIAQKVADKISAKTMTEVLPQITEMVVRKLAEEKKE